MKHSAHILILVLILILLLSGCAKFRPFSTNFGNQPDDSNAHYLLSCLKDMSDMEKEKFSVKFSMAEEKLQNGSDHDRLEFICLSFNAKADDLQFRKGIEMLQSFIDDHKYVPGNIIGLKAVADRVNVVIDEKDKALKSLAVENKRLTAEIESLQEKLKKQKILAGNLQQQIEEIKNIEKIIKSREAEQP